MNISKLEDLVRLANKNESSFIIFSSQSIVTA